MTEQGLLVHGRRDAKLAEPFEAGTVQWVRRSGEGSRSSLSVGYWFITPEQLPEPVEIVGDEDESIVILAGRIRIQRDGEAAVELATGDCASINRGTRVTWTVLEPTVEFFVYS